MAFFLVQIIQGKSNCFEDIAHKLTLFRDGCFYYRKGLQCIGKTARINTWVSSVVFLVHDILTL